MTDIAKPTPGKTLIEEWQKQRSSKSKIRLEDERILAENRNRRKRVDRALKTLQGSLDTLRAELLDIGSLDNADDRAKVHVALLVLGEYAAWWGDYHTRTYPKGRRQELFSLLAARTMREQSVTPTALADDLLAHQKYLSSEDQNTLALGERRFLVDRLRAIRKKDRRKQRARTQKQAEVRASLPQTDGARIGQRVGKVSVRYSPRQSRSRTPRA